MRRFLCSLFPIFIVMALVGCFSSNRNKAEKEDSLKPKTEQQRPQGVSDVQQSTNVDSNKSASNFSTPSRTQREQTDTKTLSAAHDGWKTEQFSEQSLQQIKTLFKHISNAKGSDPTEKLLHESFQSTVIRPRELTNEVMSDSMLSVHRMEKPVTNFPVERSNFVRETRAAIPFKGHPLEFHVKAIGIDLSNDNHTSSVLVELHQKTDEKSWQANARWECRWSAQAGELPKLTRIQVVEYEEAFVQIKGGKWFTDSTSAILNDLEVTKSQLNHGHHHWLQRIEKSHRFDTSVRNGLAIGDANADGLDDVYVCQPPGLPNLLFIRQADGTAKEVSSAAGVDWLDQTSAALFCDLDNDGDQDLVLGTPTGTLVMANDGVGNFSLKTSLKHEYDVQSISAVDYDNDGMLDLFTCIYRTSQPSSSQEFLYRDAVGGGLNRLFRNCSKDNTLAFEDVTDHCGIKDGADRYSLAASWEDFDNDGDQDLYIANDFGKNFFYQNDAGQFSNIAAEAGVEDIGSGMSVSWADYDRDGWPDLYVGNMFSSAGMRVTNQPEFRTAEDAEIRSIYRRLAKGNSLFKNLGNGKFQEVGADAGVERGRWAWSSIFTDLNNDGWNDLFVANGYMTTKDTGDL